MSKPAASARALATSIKRGERSTPVTSAPAPAASSARWPAPQPTSRNCSPAWGSSASASAMCTSWMDSATSSKAPADQTTAARCLNSVKSGMCGNVLRPRRAFHLLESLAGGRLLGLLLRPALAAPELLPVDERGAGEVPVVCRACGRDLGVCHPPAAARKELLQVRLVVDAGRDRELDALLEGGDDRALDRSEAVLQEERAERRLEPGAEAELLGHRGARRARDDMGPRLGQPPFGEVGMPLVERVRDRELEDAVAEEFEPLVRRDALARPRGVREDDLRHVRRQSVDQLREIATGGW